MGLILGFFPSTGQTNQASTKQEHGCGVRGLDYKSKDGKEEKVFDALEWLAAMCSHVPNKGQQMVRHVGFYSNAARGKKKYDQDELIPPILEPRAHPKSTEK